MRKLILLALVFSAASGFGDNQPTASSPGPVSLFSLQLSPGVDLPLGASGSVFGVGGSVLLGVQYQLPFRPWFVGGALNYDYDSATGGTPISASVGSLSLATGLRFALSPFVTIETGVSAGYWFGFLNDFTASSTNPFVSADAGVFLLPGPLHLTLGASYRYYFGFSNGIEASAGVSYDLVPASSTTPVRVQEKSPEKPQPLKAEPNAQPQGSSPSLELKDASLDDIYPVFRTYYDTHSLGKVTLYNGTDQPITSVKVSFQIKEFMTDPKDCPAPAEIPPGGAKTVDLFGLFLPSILDTSEDTKAQARIDVDYVVKGQVQHQSLVQSIHVLRRNSTTWVDDRRAAAFVTTSDPAVLLFSKNVSSMVKGKIQGDMNQNLLTAMAFFDALQLFGLTYSQDPIPTLTSNNQVADYIQFPRQTLEYKGGKCSDFSVLFTALLESVGVESAFITVPGHIFIAVSTGLSPDEARRTFSRPDDLIMREGKSWIPVEVTESAGFLQAWQDGAKEWRESLARQQAAFYPLHEAWQLYKPVGISGAEVQLNLPDAAKVVAQYQQEATKFVDQEIFSQVAALEKAVESAPDPRKPRNSLGVLYARYGLYDRAQQEFDTLLAKEEYAPALLNKGNILFLQGQKEKALDYYNRAYKVDPENPNVLLAVARASHDLENYFESNKIYAELKQKDPDLAQRFAYLDLKGEEATRAADVAGINGVVVWQE